jgi:ubiquinone biosynthesis protein Coq4
MNILSSGGYSAFQTDVINRLSKEQMNDIYLSLSMFIVSYINILKKLEDGLSISPEGKDLIKEEPVPKETKVEKKKSLLEAWVV